MQVYPTRSSVHVAFAGAVVLVAGLVAREAAVLAWGGAIVFAIALARAAALVSVARIRAAGFEMLWSSEQRLVSVSRGAEIEIDAEVRNRDTRAARYVHLRPIASSNIEVLLEPVSGEVPAGGRLRVTVRVRALRVGRHAVHGLALEVQGSPGLFEVPLTFANPYGIEVLPHPLGTMLLTARGGRSRAGAELGAPGPLSGDSIELRELREHHAGDPFKRIAWRASARRGKLLVRDFERDERDIVWVVLDASVELWAGVPGRAPLDAGIDEVATVIKRHLARGDRVGLAIVGGIVRTVVEPASGPRQAHLLAHALLTGTATYDADRSELDERDVAVRVLEHMRPLDSRLAAGKLDLDTLAFRADALLSRAPFKVEPPQGPSSRDRTLRAYLAAFGIESPARCDPERARTDEAIVRLLERLSKRKPRASIVHVWSPVPEGHRAELAHAVRQLRAGGTRVLWMTPPVEVAWQTSDRPTARIVTEAVLVRARMARERGQRALGAMGVRIERIRRW